MLMPRSGSRPHEPEQHWALWPHTVGAVLLHTPPQMVVSCSGRPPAFTLAQADDLCRAASKILRDIERGTPGHRAFQTKHDVPW